MMNVKNLSPIVLICIETKWPGSWFAMAVLGFRLLVLDKNQVLNKIKIVVRISSQKGHKYDKNIMKIDN